MKTKFIRLSKRSLAVFLGVLMLVTSIGLGSVITTSATDIGSTSFYYAGSNNSWTLTAMTKHKSGYFSYAAVSAGTQFKVSTSGSSYSFTANTPIGYDFWGYSGVYSQYTGNNWLTTTSTSNNTLYQYNTGNSYPCHNPGTTYSVSGDNYYVKNAGYVIVWYANTELRANSTPMVMVVSSLPANVPTYDITGYTTGWTSTTSFTPTSTLSTSNPATHSTNYSASVTLPSANKTYEFKIRKRFQDFPNYESSNSNYLYYGYNGTITSSNASTAKTFKNSVDTNAKITSSSIANATYTFNITASAWYDKTVNLTVTYPKLYTVGYTLGTHVNYDSVSGGTKTADGTITAVSGSNVALSVTYDGGYTYDSSNSTLNGAVASNSNKTFTFSNIQANKTITIKAKSSNTQLSAPSTVTLNGSAANCTVSTTTVGAKIRLAWSSVTNAGSYNVYKDGSLVAEGITNQYYDIERANSYSGSYTVTAVPTNTTLYSESSQSTARVLTVNKTKLNTPTVTVSPTDIKSGDSVSLTASNANSSYTAAQYNYYYYTSSLTVSDDTYKLTAGTAKSITITSSSAPSNTVYKVVAYPVNGESNDYYTQSDAASSDTVKTYKTPAYKIAGDLVGTDWNYNAGKSFTNYTSDGIYYITTSSQSSGDHYFKFYNSSGTGYSGNNSSTDDCPVTLGETNKYGLVSNSSKSFKVSGSGVFMVFFDVVNEKIWVTQNTWAISPNAYYQDFNLDTDSYKAAAAGTNGGTVSPDTETLVDKNTSTTLTATAKSGYTFAGWYKSTTFTDANKVSPNAAYTFTPSASGSYYALFKQNEPAHYTLKVESIANATVTAKYNGTTLQENGSTLSVPVGATVSVTITLDTGCQLNSTTPTGLTTGTKTFTMPSAAVTVKANVTKINYTLTAEVSPNYGTLKFYSNQACTTEITTAQYNATFYAKYTPPTEYYSLNSLTISGTGSSRTSISGNIGTFKMGTANATITASVKATTPVFGTCNDMEVIAGRSFTYTGAMLTTCPNSTLTYSFNGGAYQSSNKFTAPTTAGTYNLIIKASNEPTGITTAAEATKTVTITVTYLQHSVTYYVDMHNNTITETPTLSVVTTSGGGTVKKDNDGNNCTGNLTKVGNSTVYSATVKTPLAESGTGYSALYFKITCTLNGTSVTRVKELNSAQITTLVESSTKEIWLEAANDKSLDLKITTATNSYLDPESGKKRIFVAKPYSWGNESGKDWYNIALYHWGDYDDMGWTNGLRMDYLGYDSTDGYYYYQVDVPSTVNNIIFQGFTSKISGTGNTPSVQTGNIENIGSTNLFVLSKDGNSYKGEKMSSVNDGVAKTASFTRYYKTVQMNKTESSTVNIKPTTSDPVSFTSNNTSVVTVDSNGNLTPVGSGTATIRVNIYGTVGNLIKGHTSGYESQRPDLRYHDVEVTIADPTQFKGFNLMSLSSTSTTINIPKKDSNQPGYFDHINTLVSGLSNDGESYSGSAIVTSTNTSVSGVGSVPISYTVKYAAPSTVFSEDYKNITVAVTEVATKSIKRTAGARYGHDHWEVNGTTDSGMTTTKTVTNGIETATTGNFTLVNGSTYSAIFDAYTYVDVTFNYTYYDYNTTRKVIKRDDDGNRIDSEGNILNEKGNRVNDAGEAIDSVDHTVYVDQEYYQYDVDYVGPESTTAEGWNTVPDTDHNAEFSKSQPTHIVKTYTVTDFEVRGKTASSITAANLLGDTGDALKDMPTSNYYNYVLNSGAITVSSRDAANYKAVVNVNMTHNVKTYSVYLKDVVGGKSGFTPQETGTASGGNYYYQEYVNLTSGGNANWLASNSSGTTTNAATLATGTSYRFRVTGDTYIVTATPTSTSSDLEEAKKNVRSAVTYSGHEITHEEKSASDSTKIEKLINNFYIADFFDPAKVLDPDSDPNKTGTHIPYDNVEFVGGGVMYYSVTDEGKISSSSNVVDYGYANDDGTADKEALKTFIKERIEENNGSEYVEDDTDLANAIAYGTEIPAQVYKDNGRSTGLVYRYLPYKVYDRETSGAKDNTGHYKLVKDSETGEYTYATTVSSDTFRYSNSLQAYQYIYASKAENKSTNKGKDMRLYAYYIYSYTKYDADTGIPSTEYEVVISDTYADASTYWSNPNTAS